MKNIIKIFISLMTFSSVFAQNSAENDYYRMITLPVPEGMLLEVGGITTMPTGDVALATRRGDIWIINNPNMTGGTAPYYRKFASGLHEILGLVYKNGSFYCAQRGELTKLTDKNGDGRADAYETVCNLPISGHYHEYTFGPKVLPDGSMIVTGNVAFGDEEWWRGESRRPWRGWAVKISEDGKLEPYATGMRSPCGIGMIDGEFWYGDNQGDWMGSGFIAQVNKGDFMGHPAGLRWTSEPNSPVKLTTEQLYAKVNPRKDKDANGYYIKPENIESERGTYLFELKKDFPELKLPAVWLPHGVLGISTSEIIKDETNGGFGPFAGQVFVGDQGKSNITRVYLEKVNGQFQGAAFPFREGFQSGILRMVFAGDGSMFVGETNRGWGSAGNTTAGVERLVWTGKMPFEMKTMKAMPDGFEIEFTKPVNKATAADFKSYQIRSFTYKYHPVYGSPTVDEKFLTVKGLKVSEDGMKVRLLVDGLRQYYIHELKADGLKDTDGKNLLHSLAFYTLNNIPSGEKMTGFVPRPTNLKTNTEKTTEVKLTTPDDVNAKKTAAAAKVVPTFDEVKPLLQKHTCVACHQADKRLVGPAFKDVAKRKYSEAKIVELIYKPQPKNWPDYATEMAPMPQVPKGDALKIAAWINSLK
ncbi:cytochrome c class I [Emticicia oligotrophica DSM 17448]|uniref:Cytochrome c class I n=1 Tax=Emticicia oligotrophica (strain DSM 17448 / CIP 109782 / MTCC 6937 / GPTSA100-15) TaxID=929562 RepID=A0ABM5N285_EMTOG|nr:c-type cytochrome [Emticicia oligotrophica]AFK03536.1 cytochrome c class I [Emticicia oligotrophica DSM 17448]